MTCATFNLNRHFYLDLNLGWRVNTLLNLKLSVALFVFAAGMSALWGCRSDESPRDQHSSQTAKAQTVSYTDPVVTYEEISPILSMSCMPCHNRHTIGTVIERLENSDVDVLDGETRQRVLGEVSGLRELMDDGMPISFTSEAELQRFMKAVPGEFYTMLQKGVMPPGFAPELMQRIGFTDYKPLTWENRIKLLQYAKPYSKDYMR